MSRSLEDRFWQRVSPEPNSGCWLWDGHQCKGYGVIRSGGRQLTATHVSLGLHGRPRPGDLYACHHCDVLLCVNPGHLYWGTQAQNVADRERRGRGNHPINEANGRTKLTEDQVKNIRASNDVQRNLAVEFGVSRALISQIKTYQARRFV